MPKLTTDNYNPIICAIDTGDLDFACKIAEQLKDHIGAVKLGLEFFVANGIAGVQRISDIGVPIFLDLKFHDIPNTVSSAVREACKLNIFMLTVHISGGASMLYSAMEASNNNVKIVGVTVLTHANATIDEVTDLAKIAHSAGLDGVVCAVAEAHSIRTKIAQQGFCIVTPGIRPADSDHHDQNRIATPEEALEQGADYMVIGRPITQSKDPKGYVMQILQSIGL